MPDDELDYELISAENALHAGLTYLENRYEGADREWWNDRRRAKVVGELRRYARRLKRMAEANRTPPEVVPDGCGVHASHNVQCPQCLAFRARFPEDKPDPPPDYACGTCRDERWIAIPPPVSQGSVDIHPCWSCNSDGKVGRPS